MHIFQNHTDCSVILFKPIYGHNVAIKQSMLFYQNLLYNLLSKIKGNEITNGKTDYRSHDFNIHWEFIIWMWLHDIIYTTNEYSESTCFCKAQA